MNTSSLRAMVFDLDGTLLNTIPDIAGSLNRALTAEGLPPQPIEAYGRIVGGGIREAITFPMNQKAQVVTVGSCADEKAALKELENITDALRAGFTVYEVQ